MDIDWGKPQWKQCPIPWFSRIPDANNGRRTAIPCNGWKQLDKILWWEDPDGNTRGGAEYADLMLNLNEDANILIQLVILIRKVEGCIFIPITEDMLESHGRRRIDALIAESNPNADPGTLRNSCELPHDVLSPAAEWCLA